MKTSILVIAALALSLGISCADERDTKSDESLTGQALEISGSWARVGKAGMMSAAYFSLTNSTTKSDTLLSASSDVTQHTQIHLSYETEDGLMGMEEQNFVEIPANSSVLFKQGGLHIMIIQPERDLVAGDTIHISLKFTSGKRLQFPVPVVSQ